MVLALGTINKISRDGREVARGKAFKKTVEDNWNLVPETLASFMNFSKKLSEYSRPEIDFKKKKTLSQNIQEKIEMMMKKLELVSSFRKST